MQKYVALIVAIAALAAGLLLFKGRALAPLPAPNGIGTQVLPLPAPPILSFNQISDTPVAIEAWTTFESYRLAASKHDLSKVQSLSYQLSPVCQAALADSSKLPDCYKLMDSVAFFSSDFREQDFTHVAYDAKQIVLSTDYLHGSSTTDPVKTVIYFVRATSSPKVLGVRFCMGYGDPSGECVKTAPDTRDADKNGWWDDVEYFFTKGR